MYAISKKFNLVLAVALALGLLFAAAPGQVGAQTGGTVASQIDYYHANDGTNFWRSTTALTKSSGDGTVSQTTNADGSVTASITNVLAYADSGFSIEIGKLGDLNGILVQGTGEPFSVNLWFDVNNDGSFFSWDTDGKMTSLGGDKFITSLPSTGGKLEITDNTTLMDFVPDGGNYTLAQLKSGTVTGIDEDTPVAIWVGVTVMTGGTKAATINLVNIITAPITEVFIDNDFSAGNADGHIFGVDAFATIQEGITAVAAGGTVNVAAGTYTELITINKANVTLVSESQGAAIIKPSTERAEWPYGAVLITADGVIIDGFEIDGTTVCRNGINAYEANNVIIKNNIVHGAVNAWDGVGIMVWSWGAGTADSALIENNEVYDTGRMGIIVLDHSGSSYELTSNHIIRGNTVHDTWKVGWDDGGGSIQINVGKDSSIIDNVIYNTQNGQRGIYMFASAGGNTITGNTIRDNPIGIQLWISGEGGDPIAWGSDTPASPDVSNNDIYDNGTGAISSNIEGTTMVMDATNNWWGDISGPEHATTNPGGLGDTVSDNVAYSPWLGAPVGTVPMTFMVDDVGPKPAAGYIQTAINAASAGDTVNVAAGTYNEDLEIGKSITLLGPNAAISPNSGTRDPEAIVAPLNEVGVADIAVLATNGNSDITIKGFTFDMDANTDPSDQFIQAICKADLEWVIENNIFKNAPDTDIGYWQFTGCGASSTVVIEDNFFTNNGVSNGITMWDANRTVTVKDNVWKDNAGWAVNFNLVEGTFTGNKVLDTVDNGQNWYDDQGGFLFAEENHITMTYNTMDGLPNPYIRIYDTFKGTFNMTGNTLKNSKDPTLGIFRIMSGADLTGFVAEHNAFLNDPLVVQNESTSSLDASPNWWGTVLGPQSSQLSGSTSSDPWCGDADCSFVVSNTPPDEGEGGFYFDEDDQLVVTGEVSVPGGIELNEPGLTVVLENGAVVQNESPCFTVEADNVTITSETIGGGKCVPTDGDHGIVVNDGVQGLRIVGIEIDGSDPTGSGDGIHFAGAITNYQIVDNFIHDLDGDGVFFFAQPTGDVMEIRGNLFQNNTGLGVNNSAGTADINAEYNSWGDIGGPAGTNGDGISASVDADPWTHVDLYMLSTDQDWPDKVARHQQISYTIYGNFQNVMGADFVLDYPEGLLACLGCADPEPENPVPAGAFDTETITVDTDAGTIHYVGNNTTSDAKSGTAVELFTVTFEANNAGPGVLDLVETSDEFGMAPPAGPSNNIYAATLEDGSVEVIDIFDVTGIFSMQGRVFRGDIPVTLTSTTSVFPYGPWTINSTDDLGINWNLGSVPVGEYLVTTLQPRYLNVYAGLNKIFTLSAAKELAALELKGGNADWTDNEIDVNDASIVGDKYGTGTSADDADVNFDNRVNIFDLALVGGNYTLTSADAYEGWLPTPP